jgi:hypothetical protein
MQYDCLYIAISIGVLGFFDRLLARRCSRRWFVLHALGNGIVVVFALPGVMATIGNPQHSMDSHVFPDVHSPFGSTSKVPMSMITALHLYHIVGFDLSSSDRLHHCLFVPVICVFGHLMAWGALRQFLAFFICGLPGCIDYLQLCYEPHHSNESRNDPTSDERSRAVRVRRKYVTMMLNVCLRAPCLCFEASLHYVALRNGTTTVHPIGNLLIASLVLVNAMYYTYTSVRSYVLAQVAARPLIVGDERMT